MDLEKNSHRCHVSLQSHLSYDLLTNTISFSIFFSFAANASVFPCPLSEPAASSTHPLPLQQREQGRPAN